jgi:hypothetical protein
MGKNKEIRKKIEGQQKALEEHLEKIAQEKLKPLEGQDRGLITYWERTVENCRQNIEKLERRLNK